jgi:ATP-dependent RNA helicase HelY
MGTSGRTSTLGAGEVVAGSRRVGSIELPGPVRGNDRRFDQQVLRRLRAIPALEAPRRPKRAAAGEHPVAACPEAAAHVRWHRRAERTRQRLDQHRSRLRAEGVGLVEDFRAIQSLLTDWEYLSGWRLTPRGERLRFVYNELDLLLTESVERGLLWSLGPEELAAFASCFVYEPRGEQAVAVRWPTADLEERFERLAALSDTLVAAERRLRLPPSRRPDPGFVESAYAWAGAHELSELPPSALAPGDFVRVSRQLVDLLRQLRDTFPELRDDARAAIACIDRGVVAAQGVA